jgi:hypothetical protein
MRIGLAFSAALLLALPGCGTDTGEVAATRVLPAFLQASVAAVRRQDPPPPGTFVAPPGLTPALAATLPASVRFGTIERLGLTAVIQPVESARGVVTYSTADDRTLAFRDEMVIATRGIGNDLVAADAPSLAAVRAGAGEHGRSFWHLDGLLRPAPLRFACTLSVAGAETLSYLGRSYATRRVDETCTGPSGRFVNQFWFQGGTLRQSRQWLGEGLGVLAIRRL